jgi:hypothetical protein
MKNEFCSRLATRMRERGYTARDAARLFWICYLSLVTVYSFRRMAPDTDREMDTEGPSPESTAPASSSLEDICNFLSGETETIPYRWDRAPPAITLLPATVAGPGQCKKSPGLQNGPVPVAAASGE